ncbi:MAG: hypothetical protein HY537_02305, partial [Deltaproteobacteria bacterium]|nr:hypothetical protein [Deltaproteobacteria bacterium]
MAHLFLLAGVWLSLVASIQLQATGNAQFSEDQVIVRLRPGSSSADIAALNGSSFGEMRLIVPSLNLYVVKLRNRTTVANAIRLLNETNGVLYAQPDHQMSLR